MLAPPPLIHIMRNNWGLLKQTKNCKGLAKQNPKNSQRREERTGVPFPSLSKEIQSLTAFEKAIIKQKQWALENPGDDPLTALEKRRLEGEIEEVFTEIVETVEYRERVLAFLKALLKAFHDEAEKNEIDSPEEILDE